MERPALNRSLDAATFRNHYYLKEELVRFCRASGLPVTGGKAELTERIACFLEGKPVESVKVTKVRTCRHAERRNADRIAVCLFRNPPGFFQSEDRFVVFV